MSDSTAPLPAGGPEHAEVREGPPEAPAPRAEAAALLAAAQLEPAEAAELALVAGVDDARLLELARARAAGVPLAHLTSRQRFLGLDLRAAPGVLVPRAETELLAAAAIEELGRGGEGEPRLVDVCCGLGNLVCAIATRFPGLRAWASDLLPAAVALAQANVDALGLSGRVRVLQGDFLAPLAGLGLEGAVDVLVCNPPYISSGRLARDRAALLKHEPREAFDGGPYGLSFAQRLAREAAPFLRPGGWAMVEVGEGQDRQVAQLFARAGAWGEAELRYDERGVARVVAARKKG